MSRIGKAPISIPKDVKVTIDGGALTVKGSKSELNLRIPHGVKVESKDNVITVTRHSDAKQHRANHGTIRSHIVNMVKGVVEGHKKELELQGIGFRAQLEGKKIVFSLGFSHPVEFQIPDDVKVAVPNLTSILVEGANIEHVGQVAARIRALKPVEPYKGKGIRYVGEVVRRKQGKSVTK